MDKAPEMQIVQWLLKANNHRQIKRIIGLKSNYTAVYSSCLVCRSLFIGENIVVVNKPLFVTSSQLDEPLNQQVQ